MEGGYGVKVLSRNDELLESYRLRHKIFSEELRWVPQNKTGKEVDKYDLDAVPFGVYSATGKLHAYLRLIQTDKPFMLEEIFGCLVGMDHELRKEAATAEISRLCVSPSTRDKGIAGNFGTHRISMLLYKGVYMWCRIEGIRFLYLVVEKRIFRLLRISGFPCNQIGEAVKMPDGVDAVAAIMDWDEFEDVNVISRPELYEWFSRELIVPAQTL